MYNFSLVADFDENIVHNQRCDLIQRNLCFGLCILAEIAYNEWNVNVTWMYGIELKNQIKFYLMFSYWNSGLKFAKFEKFVYNIL